MNMRSHLEFSTSEDFKINIDCIKNILEIYEHVKGEFSFSIVIDKCTKATEIIEMIMNTIPENLNLAILKYNSVVRLDCIISNKTRSIFSKFNDISYTQNKVYLNQNENSFLFTIKTKFMNQYIRFSNDLKGKLNNDNNFFKDIIRTVPIEEVEVVRSLFDDIEDFYVLMYRMED